MWGTTTWLDHMYAELVQISNGMITCRGADNRGADNEHGGNMIDYFIMSRPLVAAIISCEADFSVPFGPHYGLKLKFKAELSKILCKTLIKAEMPKKFARPEAKGKIVAKNKIELEKARGARRLEEALEKTKSANTLVCTFRGGARD